MQDAIPLRACSHSFAADLLPIDIAHQHVLGTSAVFKHDWQLRPCGLPELHSR